MNEELNICPFYNAIKVFVSYPVHKKCCCEIATSRARIIRRLKDYFRESIKLIEPDLAEDRSSLTFLGKSLQLMDKADYVVFVMGWDFEHKCLVERNCATVYGKKILYETEDGITDKETY